MSQSFFSFFLFTLVNFLLFSSISAGFLSIPSSVQLKLRSQGYLVTPGGFFHESCIHTHSETNIDLSTLDDDLKAPCPHPKIGFQELETIDFQTNEASSNLGFQYYSNWIAYSGYTHEEELGFMTSTWKVPGSPPSLTPLLTTLFFFNGLEEELHNTSCIIQPVLSYGFSGCGGWDDWRVTAFVVSDAGRAHCGSMYAVKTGDVIRGNMTRLDTGDWVTTAEVLSANPVKVSSITSKPKGLLRFACLTMEGIRIYSCGAFPNDGKLDFYDVEVRDREGQKLGVESLWQSTVTHAECGQSVAINRESGVVSISYSNTPKVEEQ
jgi:hypothetical protein